MANLAQQAKEKIESEVKSFKGNSYGQVVYKPLAETLESFIEQSEEFAAAVLHSEKTLTDCCNTILSGIHGSTSDYEVYKRAAEFYFPGATIKFEIKVVLNGQAMLEDEADKVRSIYDFMK